MRYLFIIMLVLTSLFTTSCIEKQRRNLESPCVAVENPFDNSSEIVPCVRRRVNDHWLS